MQSDLPKVVHEVAGRAMVAWVVDACRAAGAAPIVLVIGHGADAVRALFRNDRDIVFVTQEPQLGTGHAVDQARGVFEKNPSLMGDADVLVLAGDGPLIRAETLWTMLEVHRRSGASATLATSVIPDATGYGRIVRDASGRFQRIAEHKDATPAERGIREINPSYYCFRAAALFEMLRLVDNQNASGEYYITDVLGHMLNSGLRVEVIDAVPPEDVLSINTPQQLAEVEAILQARTVAKNPSAPALARRATGGVAR